MEEIYTKKQVKELMLNAFKKGQEKTEAEDYPIKLYIASEIQEYSASIKSTHSGGKE